MELDMRELPANPVLCEADSNLAEFRRWSRQFYSAGREGEAEQED